MKTKMYHFTFIDKKHEETEELNNDFYSLKEARKYADAKIAEAMDGTMYCRITLAQPWQL